jgi:flagellar export protein FliJ
MAVFRFRAAAALDLRHRQEDAAAAALGQAEARFHEVSSASAAAEHQRARAQADQLAQSRRGIDVATLYWHRNWIIRLQAAIDDLGTQVRAQSVAVDEARRAWQLARRRRLVLERMRERALARHRTNEQRVDLKAMDELARIRFVMPDTGDEGVTDGD